MKYKNTLDELKELLKHPPHIEAGEISPYTRCETKGDKALGREQISQGKVGCLVVAGGQGTRLNFKGPKGTFPISPVTGKTLFQLLAEKVSAAGDQLPLALMTSPLNDKETRAYFAEHSRFGLSEDQLDFFTQEMLPQFTKEGEPTGAAGPNGNGYSLKYFVESGIWQKWMNRGVETLSFILIDNPLADPFDAEMIGLHTSKKADVTVKCIKRKSPEEKVGVLVQREGKLAVVEYTELPDPTLPYELANISQFCFSMDFVKKSEKIELPLHLAFKAGAYKFETFIFDLLPFADRVEVLLSPREDCFAPLKDDPKSVQEALRRRALKGGT